MAVMLTLIYWAMRMLSAIKNMDKLDITPQIADIFKPKNKGNERLETVLENIEAYNGTSIGQREVK